MTATFVRRQLGRRLRALRAAAGKTTIDVEESRVVSRSTLHKIENGLQRISVPVALALCGLYRADPETTAALAALARASDKEGGWTERWSDVVPGGLSLLLSAEVLASRVAVYDPEVVPGPLQIAAYTRRLFECEDPRRSPEHVERLLAARLVRLERFWSSPKRVTAVINEGALAREVGSRVIMDGQVHHLCDLARQGADIRILGFEAGAHPAIYGAFWIFDFPDPDDPSVAYLENYTGGEYVEAHEDIDRLRSIAARVSAISIPVREYG